MSWLLVILVIFILLGAIKAMNSKQQSSSPGRAAWDFKKRPLVNGTEQKFFWRLQEALPDHVVLTQVAVSQLLQKTTGKAAHANWNRVDRKVCDFVVCERNFEVVGVIEVDGPTHQRAKQQQRDSDKTGALEAAGYRLTRFTVGDLPSALEIKKALGLAEPVAKDGHANTDSSGRTAPALN